MSVIVRASRFVSARSFAKMFSTDGDKNILNPTAASETNVDSKANEKKTTNGTERNLENGKPKVNGDRKPTNENLATDFTSDDGSSKTDSSLSYLDFSQLLREYWFIPGKTFLLGM